jgi:hypothetical protein
MHFFFNSSVSAKKLLLDSLSVASSTAYSLRKLRKNHTGNALRVRRSSDNAELDIGFSSGELDTSTLLTHASGGSAFVTTWYDQSGKNNNATQPTAGNQPQIVNAGVVILDSVGLPSLSFTRASATFLQTVNDIVNDANMNVYLYIDSNVNNTGDDYFFRTGTAGVFYESTGVYRYFSGLVLASAVSANNDRGIFGTYAGASGAIYRNGVAIATGNTGASTATGKLNIGRGNGTGQEVTCNIGEFIVFETRLDTVERKKIEQSQSKYFNVTLA